MGIEALSDVELLARTREDPGAFGVFYRRHVHALLAFMVRRCGNVEAGADLTAEVFATALERAEGFDPARGEPVGWLYGIARHKLARWFRDGTIEDRARRRLGITRIALGDEGIERVEAIASLDVRASVLHDALAGLPAQQRDAVVARVVLEHSYEQIGERDRVSSLLARKRVSRGLAALRQRLGGSE